MIDLKIRKIFICPLVFNQQQHYNDIRFGGVMNRNHSCCVLKAMFFISLIFLSVPAWSDDAGRERITSFASEIIVNPDASIIVTESITAVVRGDEIKRGIYRDIHTMTEGSGNRRSKAEVEVLSVRRDGRQSPYHTQRLGGPNDTLRIYIGQKDVLLKHGLHTFQIIYRMKGQIQFFQDYDELYWNVTGNDWVFTIEKASCAVKLPGETGLLQHAAYTGQHGARGTNYSVDLKDPNRPEFTTTRSLPPGHGLTVAVAWPKGIVDGPTKAAQWTRFVFPANASVMVGMIGTSLLFGYYLFAWFSVGRGPRKGMIIPRFHPPRGLSPAAMRVIMNKAFDDKGFAAAIVNMAVKGYVTIFEQRSPGGRNYYLMRTSLTPEKAELSPGESAIASFVVDEDEATILGEANRVRLRIARDRLREFLYKEHEKVHFSKNRIYIYIGISITLVTMFFMGFFSHDQAAILTTIVIFGCCCLLVMPLSQIISAHRSGGRASGCRKYFNTIGYLFALLFFFIIYINQSSLYAALFVLIMIAMNCAFYFLMKAHTIEGRELMDEIFGFKMFLEVAEKSRLDVLHAPDVTPELFERYLPYAMALNVENQWAARFQQELARAGLDISSYKPLWHEGLDLSRTPLSRLSNRLSGFLATTTDPPASSLESGSRGGGFSGGGRGGGGGGGW